MSHNNPENHVLVYRVLIAEFSHIFSQMMAEYTDSIRLSKPVQETTTPSTPDNDTPPSQEGALASSSNTSEGDRSFQAEKDHAACPFGCLDNDRNHAETAVHTHAQKLLIQMTELQAALLRRERPPELNQRINTLEGDVNNLSQRNIQHLCIHSATAHRDEEYQDGQPRNRQRDNNREAARDNELNQTRATQCNDIERLSAMYNTLVGEVNKLAEHKQQTVVNTGHLSALKEKVSKLERTIALKDAVLAEQELRLRELETTSFDGTLMWVITDFSRRRQEAINGRTPSIYSTPFYTSRAGYKMCVRIHLNRDGMGKGTHISLFFVIMRGQYDAILPWPFKQKVTLMLLDQNNNEHVIDHLKLEPNSASFRRPQSAMNVASGIPLFCPLSRLEDRRYAHMKDDTMFVKVIVDTEVREK